jgi:NAD(P)-dependent dehydrogenase (short-subunit alcohol dehydrogenase family)
MAHPNFILNSRTLIIGGSSGIGFAVASGALSNGSKVHITSVTGEKLSAKVAQLQSLYPNAHVSGSVAGLSSTETLEATLQSVLDAAVKETGGALDHIVYTSGDAFNMSPLAEATAASALQGFTVRYLGPLLVGKLVAANPGRYLTPAASSSITLTSGILAHRPRPGFSLVGGVAGAVEVLARALAGECGQSRDSEHGDGAGDDRGEQGCRGDVQGGQFDEGARRAGGSGGGVFVLHAVCARDRTRLQD